MLAKNENQKQRQTNETYRDREYLETIDSQIIKIYLSFSTNKYK